jgi:hypothetical protein
MAHEYPAIDLNSGHVPDIAALAEEVHRTKQPRVIRRAPEDMEAFWSSFGSWKDVDTEQLNAANAQSRRISTKPRPA